MLIAYASKTGNIERFVHKLPFTNTIKINTGNEEVLEPCVFITYTTGIGEIPVESATFCKNNSHHILAIVGSGNRNWGSAYCIATDKLSNMYGFPVLMKFELSGRISDVQTMIERIDQLEILRIK